MDYKDRTVKKQNSKTPLDADLDEVTSEKSTAVGREDEKPVDQFFSDFDKTLALVLNEISDAVLVLDSESRVEFANRSYLKLIEGLGISISDLMQKSIWEVFSDLAQEEVYAISQRVRKEQREEKLEIYYQPIEKWMEVRLVPTGGRLICYIQDITSQKLAMQALKQGANREKLVSSVLGILLKSKEPSKVILEIFPQFEAHFGLDSFAYYLSSTEGERVFELKASHGVSQDAAVELLHLESFKSLIEHCHEELCPQSVCYPQDFSEEDYKGWCEANGLLFSLIYPLKIEQSFFGILVLGSKAERPWKSNELELAQLIVNHAAIAIDRLRSNQQLAKSEKLYRMTGDSIGYGSWLCDTNGVTLYISQCFRDVLGAPSQPEQKIDWRLYIHPDDMQTLQESWREAKDQQADHWEYESRMRTKTGEWVHVLSRGRSMKNSQGEITHWAGINLDVTKYRQAEAKLERQTQRLSLLNKMAADLAESYDVEKIAEHIANYALKLCQAEYVTVFYKRRDEIGGKQVYFVYAGYSISKFGEFIPSEYDELFTSQFLESGMVLKAEVQTGDDSLTGLHSKMQTVTKDLRSYLAAPIVTPMCELVGGIFLGHSEPNQFCEDTADLLENILDQGGIVVEKNLIYQDQQRTAEHLSLAVSIAKVGEVYWDSESDIMTMSPKALEIFALPADQKITRTQLRSYIIPADRDKAKACLDLAIESKAPYEVEYRICRVDGKRCWIATKGQCVYNEHGRLVGMNIVIQDVTPQKQVEEELRDARLRLEATLYSADIGTWTWDIQQDEFCMDKNLARMFSRVPMEEDAAPIKHFVEAVHPEDRNRVQAAIKTVLQSSQQDFEIDFRVLAEKGGVRWLTARGKIRRNAAGEAKQFPGVIIDITARRNAEIALNEAKEIAESANIAKDRFLAVLSHELRTPLTPVLMTVDELSQSLPQDSECIEALNLIRRNVELEARLIDDLLDLSRVVSGKLNLYFERTDLRQLVEAVIEICQIQLDAKELSVEIDRDEEGYMLTGDVSRLQQILWNLLKNAIKFSPTGSKIRVVLRKLDDHMLMVQVVDQGRGIEAAVLPRIFAAFEQGDPNISQQFGGLGLGLAISKALVRLHGGDITAKSDGKGKGSTFEILLPIEQDAGTVEDPVPVPVPSEGNDRSFNILLVEDHMDTGTILRKLLRRVGHEVDLARDVESALKLASEKSYDLLISDIGLPDSSGYELMKQIKAIYGWPGIAISGYGMKEDLEKSQLAGFSHHLIKPILIQDLEVAIESLMSKSEIK